MALTQQTSKSPNYCGSINATTTPTPLPAVQQAGSAAFGHEIRELFLQADSTNTDDVMIGNSVAQCVRLHPDDDFVIPLENPGTLFVLAASGTQRLNYIGRD